MSTNTTHASLGLTGRIERKTHDVSELREAYPEWDSLSKTEKRNAAQTVEPKSTDTVYNVTTDRLHQYFVDNLDPSQTDAKDNITTLWLALGDDESSGTSTADTDLNNRSYEQTVTNTADNGKELFTSTFLGSGDGNGNTYDELGLFSGNPADLGNSDVFMLNHATFTDVTKDNTETVTFDVILTFSDL